MCDLEADGGDTQTEGDDQDNGVGAAVYAGAAAAVVAFIVGVIAVIFLWRRRKTSEHGNRIKRSFDYITTHSKNNIKPFHACKPDTAS